MNKIDFAFQVMLVLCGGVIGTASAIIANYLLHRAQKAHEDLVYLKSKLEEFTTSVLLLDPWLTKYSDTTLDNKDFDETDSPILRIQMLTSLYFPNFIKDAEDLEKMVLSAQTTALQIRRAAQKGEDSQAMYDLLAALKKEVQTDIFKLLDKIRKDPTMGSRVQRTRCAVP